MFQFKYSGLSVIATAKLFYTRCFICTIAYFAFKKIAFLLGYTTYFSSAFTFLLQSKDTVLTKFWLLCESSNKFVGNCKFLSDYNRVRTHNNLVCKRTLDQLAKGLSVHLQAKWLLV